LTGHDGCVAPIMELPGHVLGIAEGIETALSAAKLTEIPTWATLNAVLLSKFEPPPDVDKLVIFADRDVAGLEAASVLMERLQERVRLEIRTPRAKDWNDVLCAT
jgi:putative DNA primase/helicase